MTRTAQRSTWGAPERFSALEGDVDYLERTWRTESDAWLMRAREERKHFDTRFDKIENRVDKLTGYAFGILVAIVSSAAGIGLVLWVSGP